MEEDQSAKTFPAGQRAFAPTGRLLKVKMDTVGFLRRAKTDRRAGRLGLPYAGSFTASSDALIVMAITVADTFPARYKPRIVRPLRGARLDSHLVLGTCRPRNTPRGIHWKRKRLLRTFETLPSCPVVETEATAKKAAKNQRSPKDGRRAPEEAGHGRAGA